MNDVPSAGAVIRTLPTTNPHAKPIVVVQCTTCDSACGEELLCCPVCGVPLDELDEPHRSPLLWSPAEEARLKTLWERCPWPHPQSLRDADGELITTTEPLKYSNGDVAPGPGIIVIAKDIVYPDDHPYWEWVQRYDEQHAAFCCPGPPISRACAAYIGSTTGPASHQTCNEECYCDCQTMPCACPEPDVAPEPKTLAIVCAIHGHVYSKTTTAGI